jgi:molybdenum cofactor cytidylyltransferase
MITCLLLAAGVSRRFGSPKPLAPIGSMTAISHLLTTLLKSRVARTVVVLGAEADKVRPHILDAPSILTTMNDRYALGQTSSFKKGLDQLALGTTGFMLLPVDTPFIKTSTVDELVQTFETTNPLILIPEHAGRSGHPPIFSIKLLEEFNALADGDPLFTIQRRHADQIQHLPVNDPGVTLSFNTPEELQKIRHLALGS